MAHPRLTLRRRALFVAAVVSLILTACGTDTSTGERAGSDGADTSTSDGAGEAVTLVSVFDGATTLDGADFDASELGTSRAVLWFWAPWCTSCRAEGPDVAEVAERYGSDVRIVGVPGRGEVAAMQQFVDDTGTGAIEHVVDDDGSIWTAFGVYGQPAFAFLDASGTIEVFVGTLGSALDERVADLASS